MAADVDTVALVLDGARDAADDVVGLKYADVGNSMALKLACGSQAGRSGSNDSNLIQNGEE